MIRFADLVRDGHGDLSDLFEEQVTRWHESPTNEPLHEWLGLTWGEYAAIVERPRDILTILTS